MRPASADMRDPASRPGRDRGHRTGELTVTPGSLEGGGYRGEVEPRVSRAIAALTLVSSEGPTPLTCLVIREPPKRLRGPAAAATRPSHPPAHPNRRTRAARCAGTA